MADTTDAKDAAVIADEARMRKDLQPLRAGDEISTGLRILTARRADKSADRVRAINRLQAQLLAQHLGEQIVAALAEDIITLDEELAELDALISEKVTERRHTRTLLSTPGSGPVLAAEFLGATGGDLTVFGTVNRFAGVAGLAPTPRDSGRITGNHHRLRRYDVTGPPARLAA